jgi:hypothetical protein
MLCERVSSKACTRFFRALTVVFKPDFQGVFALTNRVNYDEVCPRRERRDFSALFGDQVVMVKRLYHDSPVIRTSGIGKMKIYTIQLLA